MQPGDRTQVDLPTLVKMSGMNKNVLCLKHQDGRQNAFTSNKQMSIKIVNVRSLKNKSFDFTKNIGYISFADNFVSLLHFNVNNLAMIGTYYCSHHAFKSYHKVIELTAEELVNLPSAKGIVIHYLVTVFGHVVFGLVMYLGQSLYHNVSL